MAKRETANPLDQLTTLVETGVNKIREIVSDVHFEFNKRTTLAVLATLFALSLPFSAGVALGMFVPPTDRNLTESARPEMAFDDFSNVTGWYVIISGGKQLRGSIIRQIAYLGHLPTYGSPSVYTQDFLMQRLCAANDIDP